MKGWPVAGDSLYGGRGPSRPLLHAWRLALPHPRDGRQLHLVAPPPAAFVAFATQTGLDRGLAALTDVTPRG